MLGIIRRYLRMPRFFSFFSRRPTVNSGLTKLEILAMRKTKRDSNGTEGISNLNVDKGKKKYERREVRNKGRKVEKFLNFQNILIIMIIFITLIYIHIKAYSIKSIYLGLFVFTLVTIYLIFIERFKEKVEIKKEIYNIKEEREREHYVFLDRVKEIETIENNQIKKIIVKDENDYDIKTWDVGRANSILIGKKLHTNKVDVDLTNSIYSSLVSRVHGVLNRVEDIWYYEDLGSKNGSGIEKKSDRRKIKLKPNRAIKVESGDIIHIATTKILIK